MSVATATGEKMELIHPIMRNCSFFDGIPEEKYANVLRCLRAKRKKYPKETILLHIGAQTSFAGIVLSGTIEISLYDENGNKLNVKHIHPGGVFGAELACSGKQASPYQLMALTSCEVLLLDFEHLLQTDSAPCPHRMRVAANLLREFAQQTLFLNTKLHIMGQKRLRDKIKIYLKNQTIAENGSITLSFNRNELADFLYVDRSALSRELSSMRREGILTFDRHTVTLLDPTFLET